MSTQNLVSVILRKDAVRNLREWQHGADHFTAMLFGLISKAQATPGNLVKLKFAFPLEVRVWRDWQASGDEDEFFTRELGA